MKATLYILIYFFPILLTAQKREENSCKTFAKIVEDGQEFEKDGDFDKALDKYYSAQVAARDCRTVKEDSVKKMIVRLFFKIESLKTRAIETSNKLLKEEALRKKALHDANLAKKDAEEQQKIAEYRKLEVDSTNKKLLSTIEELRKSQKTNEELEIIKNNSISLNWVSESNKMNPIQGLRLLEKASSISTDTSARKIIKEQYQAIFNNSNIHQFREKKRTEDINKLPKDSVFKDSDNISPFLQSIATIYDTLINGSYTPQRKYYYNLKEISIDDYDYLEREENIDGIYFIGDTSLVLRQKGLYKVWNVANEYVPCLTVEKRNLSVPIFSPDGNYFKLSNSIKNTSFGKTPNFLKQDNGLYINVRFSPDNKILFANDPRDTRKFWEVATGKEYTFLNKKYFVFWKKRGVGDSSLKKKYVFLKKVRIHNAFFSPDSKYAIIRYKINNTEYTKIKSIVNGRKPKFLQFEKVLDNIQFSLDGNFFYTNSLQGKRFWDIINGKLYNFLDKKTEIREFAVSSDNKWLFTKDNNKKGKVWEMAKGEVLDSLNNIIDATFSPDGKRLFIKNSNGESNIWEFDTNKRLDFLKGEKNISSKTFSPDSEWLSAFNSNSKSKVWKISERKIPDFLERENNIIFTSFSPDSKWLFTKDSTGEGKIWELATGRVLIQTNIQFVGFSQNSKYITIASKHKIITYEIATGKPIQTLWVNKIPTDAQIIDNRYLYITVGKAIIKMDIQEQKGNFFSYGDGEPLDYTYEEIEEWKKVFGEKYLLPLDEEIKDKYKIIDK